MGEWCAADTDLGLAEIGAQMRAGRVNPTCVDRYAHYLREGPGTAAHRFATLALHRIRDTKFAYLSAYGVDTTGAR